MTDEGGQHPHRSSSDAWCVVAKEGDHKRDQSIEFGLVGEVDREFGGDLERVHLGRGAEACADVRRHESEDK